MSDSISASAIVRLTQHLIPEGRLLRTWPMPGGSSSEMSALEIADSAGQITRFVLRRPGVQALAANSQTAEQEYQTLMLAQSLNLPAPKPILLDMSGEIFPQPYLVIEYVDGQPEFALPDPLKMAVDMAESLSAIHCAELTNREVDFLPKTAPGLSDFHAGQRFGGNPRLEEERIRAALGGIMPAQANSDVLLHGDFWPGNLLWWEGRLAAVVDWEDACLGDPLADFAVSRLDILWIYGVGAYQAFSERYLAQTGVDVTNLPFWDLCAALRLARLAGADLEGWVAFFHPYGRADITVDTFVEHYHSFVEQALARLMR